MKTAAITLALALCLAGCATIRRHPLIAGAVVAAVATGVALSVDRSADPMRPMPLARRK
jgi:uncharacterized protein YceK